VIKETLFIFNPEMDRKKCNLVSRISFIPSHPSHSGEGKTRYPGNKVGQIEPD